MNRNERPEPVWLARARRLVTDPDFPVAIGILVSAVALVLLISFGVVRL